MGIMFIIILILPILPIPPMIRNPQCEEEEI